MGAVVTQRGERDVHLASARLYRLGSFGGECVKTKTPRLVSGVLCRVYRKCKEQLGVARTKLLTKSDYVR